MFSSMFNSFVNITNKQNENKNNDIGQKSTKTNYNIDDVLLLLNEIKKEKTCDSTESLMTTNSKVSSEISSCLKNSSNNCDSVGSFDDTKSIESLHCLFTWKLESHQKQDVITHIIKKYGNNNLDISVAEFSFGRFIGNLIISYELYRNGESGASDMKILEIGNWLDKLDKGSDDFYLSINIGLKHIRMANFVHKLFAENETGGFKRLFNEIVPFDHMDDKSKAVVYAIHAAVLIEYSESYDCFENACKYAKKACELDPDNYHWYHIYSLVLIAQRQFVHTHELYTKERLFFHTNKMCPSENEINLAIQQAFMFSDGKNTCSVNSLVLANLNQFLANENLMTPNKSLVLKTINSINIDTKNVVSNLDEDLKVIVKKHKNGEYAIPYLIDLASKYNDRDRWKILAQICSYTMLFTHNFRAGVEQFLELLKEPNISTSNLVTHHCSSFINGSKKFNLAELICNDIRLALSNSSCTSIKDNLFFYKMFFKIVETCNLKIKVVDPFMTVTLLDGLSTHLNTYYQNKTDLSSVENSSSDDESVVDKNKNTLLKRKTENIKGRIKHLQNSGPKGFASKIETVNKKNNSEKNVIKEKRNLKSTMSKTDSMKSKEMYLMDFLMSRTVPFADGFFSNTDHKISNNLSDLQKQLNLEQYAMPINTLNNSQQNNFNTLGTNSNFNQNYTNVNSSFQQYPCSKTIQSLLDFKSESSICSKSVITTNVTSSSTDINISLTKLPRLLTTQTTYNVCLKKILQNYPNSFRIYTDASKIQDNVGIAIVSKKATFSYKLTSEYTSCDAEAVAILTALDYALTESYNDYIILSDSLSTIMCIQNLNTDSSDVISSILCLIHAHQLKGNILHFIWVPGHNSIEGNEKADKLAKQIAFSTTAITYSHNSFMTTNIKYKFS